MRLMYKLVLILATSAIILNNRAYYIEFRIFDIIDNREASLVKHFREIIYIKKLYITANLALPEWVQCLCVLAENRMLRYKWGPDDLTQ